MVLPINRHLEKSRHFETNRENWAHEFAFFCGILIDMCHVSSSFCTAQYSTVHSMMQASRRLNPAHPPRPAKRHPHTTSTTIPPSTTSHYLTPSLIYHFHAQPITYPTDPTDPTASSSKLSQMTSFSWETQAHAARRASASVDASNSSSVTLAGGRAIAVARLVSLAPASARLSPAAAEALLARNGWRLRDAVDDVRREVAAVAGSGALWPPPSEDDGGLRNLVNAGNSCYLDAVLCALFGAWDAWDGVVAAAGEAGGAASAAASGGAGGSAGGSAGGGAASAGLLASVFMRVGGGNAVGGGGGRENLRATVREVVCRMRRGGVVSAAVVEAVRVSLRAAGFAQGRPRTAQEDAAEAFCFLVDMLGAPFLPLGESLLYGAKGTEKVRAGTGAGTGAGGRAGAGGGSRGDDERVASERLLWLALGEKESGGDGVVEFEHLLQEYFYGDRLQGLRRNEETVDAWKHRRVIPFYTPVASTGEVAAVNDARAFNAVAVPFALKRFDARGRKSRTRVPLPLCVDFSDFVDGIEAGRHSLVLRSVVCHLGSTKDSGHYVAYTRDPFTGAGWRRWDDMAGGKVCRIADGALSARQVGELERDAYLVFYELVAGDGSADPRDALYHVRDCDLHALQEDDQAFAEELQRMEFDDFSRNADCHLQ